MSFKLKTNVIIIVIFQHFILKREQSVTEPDHLPPNGDEVNLNFILHKLNIKVKTNLFTKTVRGVIFARIVTSNWWIAEVNHKSELHNQGEETNFYSIW